MLKSFSVFLLIASTSGCICVSNQPTEIVSVKTVHVCIPGHPNGLFESGRSPQCRVTLVDGRRVTVYYIVAEGDQLIKVGNGYKLKQD